jgi:hypothetical protein
MPVPDFSPGEILTAGAMDSIGMWLVKSQTISGTATQVNDCFTGDYDSYKIVLSGISSSGVDDLTLRFATAGSVNTTSNYYSVRAAGASAFTVTNTVGASYAFNGLVGNTTSGGGTIEIQNPYSNSLRTTFQSAGIDTRTNGSPMRLGAGFFDGNTRFDGIWISTLNGGLTMGGTIRIYGYRN